MTYRLGRGAIGIAAALTMAVPAMAQTVSDLPTYKQASRDTEVTYDQAIVCQAVYVALGSQYDEGTKERGYYLELYASWYEFSAEVYPIDFAQHHDADMDAESSRLLGEWATLGDAKMAVAVEDHLNACEMLEDAELLFI